MLSGRIAFKGGLYMPIMSASRREPAKPQSTIGTTPKSACPLCCCAGEFGKKIILTLVALTLVYIIFFLGTLIYNNLEKHDFIGQADKMERTITVNGFGEVNGQNNIAVTTIGYSNTDKEVAKAQADNKEVMDKVMADLQKMGIEDKDLQSNYVIYPDYNYSPDKGQELVGYNVSNNITIKIRDLSKINEILGLAGKYGATEVGGLSFTIDDPSNLKDEARDKAMADARIKAVQLANALGVRLGEIINYNEYDSSNDYVYTKYYGVESSMGMGGIGGGSAPDVISGGSKDVSMNVNITFEILQ